MKRTEEKAEEIVFCNSVMRLLGGGEGGVS